MKEDREFDLILWGATSFVGKITAEYLHNRLGSDSGIRWALGARSAEKLDALQAELGSTLPTFVGDSFDTEFLSGMTARSKVVLTTVGPYLKYGEPMLEACAITGTDYADLTGEIPFVQAMMDKYAEQARQSGARIVNCSGFDSLPSDLGVLFLQEFVEREAHAGLEGVEMQVRRVRGGLSGGTVASGLAAVDLIRNNPDVAKILKNPYSICPEGKRKGPRQPSLFGVKRSRYSGHWLHHFFMAPVNTKVVHGTNARLGYPYGEDFSYTEWQCAPNPMVAYIASAVVGVMMTALYFPWSRNLLSRFVLPAPGEGPSRVEREKGHFELLFYGTTREDQEAICRVTGDADPGYGSTAKQFAEVGLGLLDCIRVGGFWTPASALGTKLIEPLTEHAGLTFEAWLPK